MVIRELQAERKRWSEVLLGTLMVTPQVEFSLLYVTRSRLTCLKVMVTDHILSQMNPVCTSRPYSSSPALILSYNISRSCQCHIILRCTVCVCVCIHTHTHIYICVYI